MTAAARQRRHRARIRAGERVFRVVAPTFSLADALTESGWLQAWNADDPKQIEAALGRAVASMPG